MVARINQRYNNQRISAGEFFNVRDKDINLLTKLGRVKDMPAVMAMSTESNPELVPVRHVEIIDENTTQTEAVKVEQAIEAVEIDFTKINLNSNEKQELADDIQQSQEFSRMLRERAVSLGIHVDGRWSDARVQREIDEHNKKIYQHMSMRASE